MSNITSSLGEIPDYAQLQIEDYLARNPRNDSRHHYDCNHPSDLKDFIITTGPYCKFLTIAFNGPIGDGAGRRLGQDLYKRISRKVAGRRKCLEAVWVAETCTDERMSEDGRIVRRPTFANVHYHILIKKQLLSNGKLLDWRSFDELLSPRELWKMAYGLAGRRLNVDIRTVKPMSEPRLANYLIKDWKIRKEDFNNYWGSMSWNGFEGLQLDPNRKTLDLMHSKY